MKGVLVMAVGCLAAGLFVIFYFCHGETGLSFAYPLSGCAIHIDITTTGAGVPAAVGLTLVGVVLLIVATIIALIGLFQRNTEVEVASKKRESAFEE